MEKGEENQRESAHTGPEDGERPQTGWRKGEPLSVDRIAKGAQVLGDQVPGSSRVGSAGFSRYGENAPGSFA